MKFAGILTAENITGICRQGQTLPVYAQVSDGRTFLVKHASKRSTLGAQELAIELLVNWIAQSMSLVVAAPALIALSDNAVAQLEGLLDTEVIDRYAVGLQYTEIRPYLVPGDRSSVSNLLACDVAALDLLVANGDRVPENPNVAWSESGLMVFDHEHCLEFPTSPVSERFELHRDLLEVTLSSHLFRDVSRDILRGRLLAHIGKLNLETILRSSADLQTSWTATLTSEIKNLAYIQENADAFVEVLWQDNGGIS